MSAYVVAHLHKVAMPPHHRVPPAHRRDSRPFQGRFLIHGGPVEILAARWAGDLIVIKFPDHDQARAWYASPAHQAFLPLLTDNAEGDAIIVSGVSSDHRATDVLTVAAHD